jgi:predicted kinase
VVGDDGPVRARPVLLLVTGPPGTGKSTVAAHAAALLEAPVLGWDWAMAALTGFPTVQAALTSLDKAQYHRVGWSILGNLALAQLRRGASVVLDGTARTDQVALVRSVAVSGDARLVIVSTWCSDPDLHRAHVEGRQRRIPGWHELDWAHVADVRSRWETPIDAALHLDAALPLADNFASVTRLLQA